jgi:uncharacterized protein
MEFLNMPRPKRCRFIGCKPCSNYFKPRGIPLFELEEINITLDEFEAIRLADLEGLYQEKAAKKMNISRPTFTRLIESAHKKIADAIVKGKALKIDGGVYKMANLRKFKCSDCSHEWEVVYGTGRPGVCPKCDKKNIHRSEDDRGYSKMGKRKRCCGGTAKRNKQNIEPNG